MTIEESISYAQKCKEAFAEYVDRKGGKEIEHITTMACYLMEHMTREERLGFLDFMIYGVLEGEIDRVIEKTKLAEEQNAGNDDK